MAEAIDNAQYDNNEPVSANIEVSTITIVDWDNVKALDKTIINMLALAKGFTVV